MKNRLPDLVLLFIVFILLAIGIVMVFSASTSTALAMTKSNPDPYYFLKRQLLWLVVGLVGMIFAYRMDLEKVRKATPWLYLITVMSLAIVLVPRIGISAGGARRWLAFGPLSFQPSEISKVILVLFVAWFLTRHERISTSFTKIILPLLFLVMPVIALVFKEPDFGTSFLLLLIFGTMLCISGLRTGQLAILASASIPVGFFFMLTARYRLTRWTSFFHPWKDPLGGGYHIIQGLIALGSGGLFGLGLGAGRQKYFYLPEQHTDYIFAVLGEEGGFVATFLVLLLFVFIAARGMNIALKQKDPYAKMLGGGLTAAIVGQAVLNMAMVMSLIPPAGVALPFISYGGSSLLSAMISVGLLLNLSRMASASKPHEGMQEKLFLERT